MNNNLSVLDAGPASDPARLTWPVTLPLEIALGVPLDDVRAIYSIDDETWENFKYNEIFRKEILAYQEKLTEGGYSYKTKAQVQAEGLLLTSWNLIHDKDTPAAVKADLIKFTARLAGYDSQQKNNALDAGSASGFTININMGTPHNPTNLIEMEVQHLDQQHE